MRNEERIRSVCGVCPCRSEYPELVEESAECTRIGMCCPPSGASRIPGSFNRFLGSAPACSSFGAHVEGRGGDVASLVCVPAIDSEWPFLCGLCSASHSITRCAVERQYRHLIGRLL